MFENIGHGLEQLGLQANAIGGSSRSGRNWGAAVEADTNGHNRRAAAEADANEEQQLKRIDAIGEQQLKRTQLGSSSSAQGTVQRWITP